MSPPAIGRDGVAQPVDVPGHSGVHPGDAGVTRGGAEADDAHLVPVTIILEADQGPATVTVTAPVAVTPRTLHLVLKQAGDQLVMSSCHAACSPEL